MISLGSQSGSPRSRKSRLQAGAMNRVVAFLFAINILQGCSVAVPQVDAFIGFAARAMDEKHNADKKAAPPLWLASMGNSGAVLHPYSSGGFIVFANQQGDAFAFDGWIIRSVIGFGLEAPLSVQGRVGDRVITFEGSEYAYFCDDWIWQPPSWNQNALLGTQQ